jgi:ATP-dependent Clp protease adaptor protein ClpS
MATRLANTPQRETGTDIERKTATQIMLTVHREGKGVCGIYTRDIAATKVELVSTHARQAGHPLQCVMEEA